jgi:histidinol phosphatase-like enzyme
VVSWIRLFKTAGYLAIAIANQRGIALGRYSEADLRALHDKMRAELAVQGAILDRYFLLSTRGGRLQLPQCPARHGDSGAAEVGHGRPLRIPFVLVRDGRVVEGG